MMELMNHAEFSFAINMIEVGQSQSLISSSTTTAPVLAVPRLFR
jgi:hypothetical protein